MAARIAVVLTLAALLLGACSTTSSDERELASTETTRTAETTVTTRERPSTTTSGSPRPQETPDNGEGFAAGIPAGDDARIVSIVDGDTVDVRMADDASLVRVRLLLIDTPETKHPREPIGCMGPEASAFTESLLPVGTPVRLEYDVESEDRYGRTLAHLYLRDGTWANLEILRAGLAEVKFYEPNTRHLAEMKASEAEASAKGAGMWTACAHSQ